MSREISADFEQLKEFFKNYNLRHLLEEPEFLLVLSKQHKKYFAFLTCIAELNSLKGNKSLKPPISDKQINFINEACSDAGISIFTMSHGAYKAAKIMQRSSIETFLKGFTLDDLSDIDEEKSVYNIFDRVKNLTYFKLEPQKDIIGSIHNEYKLLCRDTHTASDINMAKITALNYFPSFSKEEAQNISQTIIRLIQNYVSLLCLKYSEHFHNMHHRNKENIIESVPKDLRPIIYGLF